MFILTPRTHEQAPGLAGKDFAEGEAVLDYLSGLSVTAGVLIRGRQGGQSQREEM